jgi:anti-anti-sigma factor
MSPKNVTLTLPASLQYSSAVRHVADEVCGMAKLNKAWCNRLKLVVDELFMNAVIYGSKEAESLVRVVFEYDDQGIAFHIEDEGKGPKPMTPEALKALIVKNSHNGDVTRTSGRGLGLISSLWTDSIEVAKSDFGGIKVSCRKKKEDTLPPPLPSVAPLVTEPLPVPAVPSGPVTELKLVGDMDQVQADEKLAPVHNAVKALKAGEVLVLDLSGVGYINSTFIGHLAGWHNALKAKNATLQLTKVSPVIREVLDLVGLTSVVTVKP